MFDFDNIDLSENIYSQYGTECIIKNIFEKIGLVHKSLVDLGAGDGMYLSNTRIFVESGWNACLIDGNGTGENGVKKAFITRENILSLIEGTPNEFDLLSIDLDGNDIYILEEILTHYSPRLIVSEVNGSINPEKSLTIPYNAAHEWENDNHYGYSLAARHKLAQKFGYTIICNHLNLNLFYLRNDILFGRHLNFKQGVTHPINKNKIWKKY